MNRYTQLSTTQFNPLSIEELSLVPVAMRQKHDASNLQLEDTRTKMNAAIDALPQHSERASQLVSQMNKLIDSESEKLAKNGYTNMTGSNLTKLNRDYQSIMSPNGELGKIASAKKAYAENYKQFVEDAQKKGHTLADIQRNWQSHNSSYFGYDSEGKVANIGLIGAPDKYDPIDAVKEIQPLIGETQRRLDQMGGGSVSMENGLLVVRNKSGSVHQLTNAPQIQQANQYLQAQFFTPGSKGFESSRFKGKDFRAVNSEINGLLGMMIKDKITDTRSTSVSASQLREGDGDGDASGNPLSSLISANTVQGRVGSEHMSNINTVNTRLNALNKIPVGERSLTQQAEIESLSRVKSDQKLYLNNHKDYQKFKSQYEAEAKKSGYSTNKSLEEIYKLPHIKNETDPKMKAALVRAESDKNKANPKLVELQRKMNNIESSFKPKAIESDLYSIVDTGKSGDKRIIEGLDSSFASVLKSGNFATGNNFDIASITFDGKTRGQGTSFDLEDKQEIQKVISGTSRKDIKTIGVRPIGTSGLVEYEIEITPQKGNKGNINRLLRSEKGSGTIGDGKSFILNVVTNITSDKAGINTIAGYTTKYFANRGAEGKQVADMMIGNMNRSNVNSTFKADSSGEPVTYGQFFNNPKNYYSDENSLRAVQDMIITDAFETQYRNGYFGDKDMKDITEKERERAVSTYLNNNIDNPIITW